MVFTATHGHSRGATYTSWVEMNRRCKDDPACRDYARYAGRGITVCERWRNDFAAFLSDMGERPGRGYSIDRIDNNRGYEPGNCRWATRVQQRRNQSRTKLTPETVAWIRKNNGAMSYARMAMHLGVAQTMVSAVARGVAWAEAGD